MPLSLASQNLALRPAALTSPGLSLEIQAPRPHRRPSKLFLQEPLVMPTHTAGVQGHRSVRWAPRGPLPLALLPLAAWLPFPSPLGSLFKPGALRQWFPTCTVEATSKAHPSRATPQLSHPYLGQGCKHRALCSRNSTGEPGVSKICKGSKKQPWPWEVPSLELRKHSGESEAALRAKSRFLAK